MTEPVQQLAPGVYLITGPAIDAIRYSLRVTTAARHRNGLPVPREITKLAAALADPGHADSEPPDVEQHQPHDHIDTREAAELLGCTPRTARRLAPHLDGHLTAGRWLLSRHAVTQHLEGKTT